ncbi:MAG: response regulator [Pseudomonadota bacterium]
MSQADEAKLEQLKGISVLLAEDNVTNQLVATQMLKALGAEVDIAADGAIALERLKERSYDVLLIDIEMPRVSGLDVIRAVRASDGPLANAPVIALTAYAMQEHRDKIQKVGADGLIPKPITSIQQFGLDILTYLEAGKNRAGAAGAAEDAPLIERSIFDGLAASIGEDAMRDLIEKVENDLIASRDQIDSAAETGDMELMRSASHVLISVAGAVGGVRLQRQAERLNRLAHDGAADELRDLARTALSELDGVLGFVSAERTKAG